MKILIVGPAYPLRGGIAHYIALLATHLQRRHSVEIISFKRQYPKLFFPGKSQEEKGGERPSVRIESLLDSINPINWIRIGLTARRREVDLIIFKYWLPFFGPSFGTVAGLARRGGKTKVLCICDNVLPHERRPGDVLFTRFFFSFVDFFIVQSATVEKELTALLPNAKYKKAPHPIYEIFGPAMKKEEARNRLGLTADRMLLFFGYVRPYKGLHLLLEALPMVVKELPVTLYIVGEFYEKMTPYVERTKSLGLEKYVHIIADYVSNDQVGVYFSASDAVVLPYVSATQSGIAQIAYHFDRPVIATDVGGLAEVVVDKKTGFLVPPNDPRALAETILRFYTEKREEEFCSNVRDEKGKYTWERFMQTIEELVALG
jgi:glycosyltransferase involved in cell wall biosynthesis